MTEQHFKGLTTKEAKKLQEKFGKNELVAEKFPVILTVFLSMGA